MPSPPLASRAVAAAIQRRRSSLPLLIVVVLILAAFASLYLFGGTPQASPLERLYRSVVIFAGNGGWAFDRTQGEPNANVLFRVFAIVAPLFTILGLTELATGAVGLLIVRVRAAILRGGLPRVGLFGLDENSLTFAAALAETRQYRPDIYAREPDGRLLECATRLGIPVLASPESWRRRLWQGFQDMLGTRAPAERAAARLTLPRDMLDVVSFLPGVDAQIGLVARLRPPPDGTIALLMPDRGFAQRLESALRFAPGDRGAYPRLVDLDALAARLLLTTHPLDVLADAADQQQIHLAIYGFGRLGRAVAKEAARLYVTRQSSHGRRLRITVVDRRADARASWLAEDPGAEDAVDVTFRSGTYLHGAGFTAADVDEVVPNAVTAHVIALGDPQTAFALAVSLRRWLLEPPSDDEGRRLSHLPAPIFIRAAEADGLGRLVHPGPGGHHETEQLPDGIFAFGRRAALFSPESLLGAAREAGARAAHAAYEVSVGALPGSSAAQRARREAERAWRELTPQLRDSNYCVVDHLAVKARAIGYRLDDPVVAMPAEDWRPDETMVAMLSQLEHRRYLAERFTSGWRYAPNRCDAVRVHPDLVPWEELSEPEQSLDEKQILALADIAKAMGKRLAAAFVVGVVGHRDDPARVDERHVRSQLSNTLHRLRRENPTRSMLLLTTLAPGTDSWAAACAEQLRIPYLVVLPLPCEIYAEDFDPAALRTFREQVAAAEYYVEVPMRAGRASKLTCRRRENLPNRERRAGQYAQAGAYIVERAHQMIAVWDGGASRGTGGTAEVVSWLAQGVPPEYRTGDTFRAPVQRRTPIAIPPFPPQAGRSA